MNEQVTWRKLSECSDTELVVQLTNLGLAYEAWVGKVGRHEVLERMADIRREVQRRARSPYEKLLAEAEGRD